MNLSTGAAYRAAALWPCARTSTLPTRRGLRARPRVALDPEVRHRRNAHRGARSPLPEVSAAASKVSAHAPLRRSCYPYRGPPPRRRGPGWGPSSRGEISVPSSFLTLNLRFTYPPPQSGRAGRPLRRAGRGARSHKGRHSQARPPGLRAGDLTSSRPTDAVTVGHHLLESRGSHSAGSRPRHRLREEHERRCSWGRRKPGEMTRRYRLFRRAMTCSAVSCSGIGCTGRRRCLPTDP